MTSGFAAKAGAETRTADGRQSTAEKSRIREGKRTRVRSGRPEAVKRAPLSFPAAPQRPPSKGLSFGDRAAGSDGADPAGGVALPESDGPASGGEVDAV